CEEVAAVAAAPQEPQILGLAGGVVDGAGVFLAEEALVGVVDDDGEGGGDGGNRGGHVLDGREQADTRAKQAGRDLTAGAGVDEPHEPARALARVRVEVGGGADGDSAGDAADQPGVSEHGHTAEAGADSDDRQAWPDALLKPHCGVDVQGLEGAEGLPSARAAVATEV